MFSKELLQRGIYLAQDSRLGSNQGSRDDWKSRVDKAVREQQEGKARREIALEEERRQERERLRVEEALRNLVYEIPSKVGFEKILTDIRDITWHSGQVASFRETKESQNGRHGFTHTGSKLSYEYKYPTGSHTVYETQSKFGFHTEEYQPPMSIDYSPRPSKHRKFGSYQVSVPQYRETDWEDYSVDLSIYVLETIQRAGKYFGLCVATNRPLSLGSMQIEINQENVRDHGMLLGWTLDNLERVTRAMEQGRKLPDMIKQDVKEAERRLH